MSYAGRGRPMQLVQHSRIVVVALVLLVLLSLQQELQLLRSHHLLLLGLGSSRQ